MALGKGKACPSLNPSPSRKSVAQRESSGASRCCWVFLKKTNPRFPCVDLRSKLMQVPERSGGKGGEYPERVDSVAPGFASEERCFALVTVVAQNFRLPRF